MLQDTAADPIIEKRNDKTASIYNTSPNGARKAERI
jgi:hypothetical protein